MQPAAVKSYHFEGSRRKLQIRAKVSKKVDPKAWLLLTPLQKVSRLERRKAAILLQVSTVARLFSAPLQKVNNFLVV